MSARTTILAGALALVLVPLAAMLTAWLYERWLVETYEDRLKDIAAEVRATALDEAALSKLAADRAVLIRIIHPDGAVRATLGKGDEGVWVRGPFEIVSSAFEIVDDPHEDFGQADALLGPVAQRPEVRSALGGDPSFAVSLSPNGQTVAMSFAAPVSADGATAGDTLRPIALIRAHSSRSENGLVR